MARLLAVAMLVLAAVGILAWLDVRAEITEIHGKRDEAVRRIIDQRDADRQRSEESERRLWERFDSIEAAIRRLAVEKDGAD